MGTTVEKITISNEYPTNLLKDFMSFLNYFENKGVKLTKTNQYIARKDLLAIYGLMSEPKLIVSEKSNQPAYPLIHLFYNLALELRLLQKRSMDGGVVAIIHPKRFNAYKQLTASEQYVTLLECFWLKSDWKELQGGYCGKAPINIDFLFEYLDNLPINIKLNVCKERELKSMLYEYEHFLFYLSFFGFWEVELDEEKTKEISVNYHAAKSITLTPLFKQLQEVLVEIWDEAYSLREEETMGSLDELLKLFGFDASSIEEDEEEIDPQSSATPISLFSKVQPLFADGELSHTLSDDEQTITTGRFLFKVALRPSCWRTIQLSESHTLLDLHKYIQRAFEFDDDHLYTFYMDGKMNSKKRYNAPMDFDGPYVNEAKIGQLGLNEGQRILYLFDFGDEWKFTVDVLEISAADPGTPAAICGGKGEAPSQYDWYDE